MSDLISKLHDAVFSITPHVIGDYKHMKKPWEMILGGLILPIIAREDPDVIKTFPHADKLLKEYSKERVISFFSPKEIVKEVEKEKIVEKIIEKPVDRIVEKVVERIVHVSEGIATPSDGKFRRIKGEISKVKRFERNLECADRDILIRWWNTNQRLVPDDDPICVELTALCNKTSTLAPISPAQLAGYFSHLCRLGMDTAEHRTAIIARSIKRGSFTETPEYNDDLLAAIIEHYRAVKEDEKIRIADHTLLREARARGEALRIKTPIVKTETEAVMLPEIESKSTGVSVVEEFDIKFM